MISPSSCCELERGRHASVHVFAWQLRLLTFRRGRTALLGAMIVVSRLGLPAVAQEQPSTPAANSPAADSTGAEADSYDRSQERTWTDRQGRQQKAKFSGVLGGNVLLKVGPRIERVPLAMFSNDDLNWIREVLRRENKLNQLPLAYREAKEPAAMATPSASADSTTPDSTTPDSTKPGSGTPNSEEPKYDRFTERIWTDADGKQVTGTFLALFREDVQIRVTGSGIVRVPLANLSAADIDWIREFHRRNNQLNSLPPAYRFSPDDPPSMDTPAEVPEAGLRDMRVWTDRKGNKATARYFAVSGTDLKLTSRGIKTVPLAQLSRDDLIWLQDALKEEGRLHELPLAFRDPPDESLSERELVRQRRTGYVRKWTLYNGKSFVATYVNLSDGSVLLHDGSQQRGFPWDDLSDEDQEYVRARLEREIAGSFFPDQADIALSLDETENGWRLWTDLDGKQIRGRYLHRDHGLSVAVLETPDGEHGYIYDFLAEEDRNYIDAETKRRIAAQKAEQERLAAAARQQMENFRNQRSGSRFPSSGDQGSPSFPEPRFPEFKWVFRCTHCGAEFTEDDGVKQGDPCPRCNRLAASQGGQQAASSRMSPQHSGPAAAYKSGYQAGQLAGKVFLVVCGIVAIVFVIQKASGR